MEVITSKDNRKIKLICKLTENKKERESTGLYVAEGARWILDALSGGFLPLFQLIAVKESYTDKYLPHIDKSGVEVIAVADNIFDKMSSTENSQGIIAVLRQKPSKKTPSSRFVLFLDRIRDPGNLGTIIRTAVAAGYSDIIFNACADVYNPKVIRSCMSAVLNANLFYFDNVSEVKDSGYKIICADIGGNEISAKTGIGDEKACLVIGSEAEGIDQNILSEADFRFKIPMEKTESLNAAVSAGILMYFLKLF